VGALFSDSERVGVASVVAALHTVGMQLLTTGDPVAATTYLMAHGAGAPMDSAWMDDVAALLVSRGIRVVRFEFAYMAGRREGVRKPPPRAESVAGEFRDAVTEVRAALPGGGRLIVGGKSMGGRVASLIADELQAVGDIAGLAVLSYPFHPAAKPSQLRTAHLADLRTPTLICQGTRDPLGSRAEVATYALSPAIELHWLEDGDHDLRPRKAISGRTLAQNLSEAADALAAFAAALP
jgi:predicted alpha/beta-hydrolase family hydrolase